MGDRVDGFVEGLSQGLIDTGKYLVRDSFEARAYGRKKEVEQRFWEERNAITYPQQQALKETEITARKQTAKTVADARIKAADKKAQATIKAADKLANSKLTLEDKKAKNKAAVEDKKILNPVMFESALSDTESTLKALNKRYNVVRPGGLDPYEEDATLLKKQIAAVKIRRDALMKIKRLKEAGKTEEVDKFIGDFLYKYGGKPEDATPK